MPRPPPDVQPPQNGEAGAGVAPEGALPQDGRSVKLWVAVLLVAAAVASVENQRSSSSAAAMGGLDNQTGPGAEARAEADSCGRISIGSGGGGDGTRVV